MLVAADWVLPIAASPIREGAVLVSGRRIAEVGSYADLRARHPHEPVHEYPDCAITPGLINAHTHLSLTALHGLVEPRPFAEWLPLVARAMLGLNADDLAASAVAGSLESLSYGVTAVGDVTYGPESIASAGDVGLGGVFYWEVLGMEASDLARVLRDHEFPNDADDCGSRTACGLSAHTPYTSGPELIAAAYRAARDRGVGFMMHAGESPAEQQLLRDGTGPLADTASRLAHGFSAPRTGAIRYLDRLCALDSTVLVHCVHVLPDEFPLLPRAAGVVLCPRSNAYLRNGTPPVERIVGSGALVALGTDSAASNADLDVRAEARALRAIAPTLTASQLLRMLTVDAARVLGLDGFGALVPGAPGDLAVFPVDASTAPEVGVIEAPEVRAVLSGGLWRVLETRETSRSRTLDQRLETARRKARLTLRG